MSTKLITCPMCPWKLVTPHLNKMAVNLADAHVQFHANQMTADLESYLETLEENTDG